MLKRMARTLQKVLIIVFQTLIIQSISDIVLAVASELCTKAVSVQNPAKKMHVLRRVPAACSNWDKSWSWLTKVDCGTKYRREYVTVPPREAFTYRIEYVCCKGDDECEKGMDISDKKFLAIVLGSTAAALLIVAIVIIISLCHRRRHARCPVICEERSHIYETAEDIDEAAELHGEREICIEDTGTKVCESEYEEIDCKRGKSDGLPRYTDLFGEKNKLAQDVGVESSEGDPFNNASAPPLTLEDPEQSQECKPSQSNVQEVLSGTAIILAKEAENVKGSASGEDEVEKPYYNFPPGKDMQENGLENEGDAIISDTTDCKQKTPDCSNYEKLIQPDTESGDNHIYQRLVDISDSEVPQGAAANDSTQIVETSQTSVTMNGHVEAASC